MNLRTVTALTPIAAPLSTVANGQEQKGDALSEPVRWPAAM